MILRASLGLVVAMWCMIGAAFAANTRADLEKFLEITGFDVSLESIRLSASSAPSMLGFDAEDFGSEWTRLADRVFETQKMHDLALDILSETLSEDLLTHANAFYTSDLGRRIVAAENASHMQEDDDAKTEAGEAIISGLVRLQSDRVQVLKRMNTAADSAGTSIRALQEIQVRFLMAAAGAGVIELSMDEADLRAMMKSQEGSLRLSMAQSALVGSAYTYQAFSDEEVVAYTEALEHPKKKEVYNLMNAVQYEVMANRFEALAAAMAALQPSTDL